MAWIRDALWLLLAWISPKRHVHGVEAFIAEEFDLKVGFSELEAALRLISTYDPNRLRRLQRDVKRILIAGASGAVYIPRLRTCRIGVTYLKREDPLRLSEIRRRVAARDAPFPLPAGPGPLADRLIPASLR